MLGRLLGRRNSGDVSYAHTATNGNAWVHVLPLENPRNRGDLARLPPLFTSLPAMRILVTYKSRKIRKIVGFNFSFLFQIHSRSSFFSDLFLPHIFFFLFRFTFFSVSGGWRYVQGVTDG